MFLKGAIFQRAHPNGCYVTDSLPRHIAPRWGAANMRVVLL